MCGNTHSIIEPNLDRLEMYIGRKYNETTKSQIENEFHSYKVWLCDEGRFYCEDHLNDRIRCVVENDKIKLLCFN
jgi:hypothetical protein